MPRERDAQTISELRYAKPYDRSTPERDSYRSSSPSALHTAVNDRSPLRRSLKEGAMDGGDHEAALAEASLYESPPRSKRDDAGHASAAPSSPSSTTSSSTTHQTSSGASASTPRKRAPRLTRDEMKDPVWVRRIEQRQKQVDYGRNTIGYDTYRKFVPRHSRRRGDVWTPDVHLNISKRCWDGLVKKWRRELHKWDDFDGTTERPLACLQNQSRSSSQESDQNSALLGASSSAAASKAGASRSWADVVSNNLPTPGTMSASDGHLASQFDQSRSAAQLHGAVPEEHVGADAEDDVDDDYVSTSSQVHAAEEQHSGAMDDEAEIEKSILHAREFLPETLEELLAQVDELRQWRLTHNEDSLDGLDADMRTACQVSATLQNRILCDDEATNAGWF